MAAAPPPAAAGVTGETSPNVRYAVGPGDDLPTYPSRPSFREFHSALSRDTMCVVFDGSPHDPYKPASVPIYQTAVSAVLRGAEPCAAGGWRRRRPFATAAASRSPNAAAPR